MVKEVPQMECVTDESTNGTDITLSPLPELIVEIVPKRKNDEDEIMSINMMNIFKEFFPHGRDACADKHNTTQNMPID